MKRQHKVENERQARKNPKLTAILRTESKGFDDSGNIIPTTDFDEAHLYASDEGVDADAVSHTLTRGEVETELRKRGLSNNEQAVVLAVVCDRLNKVAEIASETKLHRHTVKGILQRRRVREVVKYLRSGAALPTGEKAAFISADKIGAAFHEARARVKTNTQRTPDEILLKRIVPPGDVKLGALSEGVDLRELDEMARAIVDAENDYSPSMAWRLSQVWTGTPKGFAVALIRWCPRALLDEQHGPELVTALVELLEEATRGDAGTKAAAWKELATLTKPGSGDPREFDPYGLGIIAQGYYCRVVHLQREWKAGKTSDKSTGTRLVEIRRAHPEELDRFTTDNKLQRFLEGSPLVESCTLAAKATKLGADSFKRGFDKLQRTR